MTDGSIDMGKTPLSRIEGLLLDLDGVFFVGPDLIPGAAEALSYLRAKPIPFRFTTNTTTRSRETIAREITAMGLPVGADEIISAPYAAVLHLRENGNPCCHLLVADAVKNDFAEFRSSETAPDVVVIGDIGDRWNYDLLNRVFRMVMDGAQMVALHKGRFWQMPDGLQLDIGVFVAGLEYATGQRATVIGKPSPAFYHLAVAELGLSPGAAAMIGDDIDSDVQGAQDAGLSGILVKTGKYRPEWATASGVKPDAVWDSIAALSDFF